jgi:hypothetical protein
VFLKAFLIYSYFVLLLCIDFINNRIERSLGIDLNGDGYIGGEGITLKHILYVLTIVALNFY